MKIDSEYEEVLTDVSNAVSNCIPFDTFYADFKSLILESHMEMYVE